MRMESNKEKGMYARNIENNLLKPSAKKSETDSSTTSEKAINTIQNRNSGSSKNVFN